MSIKNSVPKENCKYTVLIFCHLWAKVFQSGGKLALGSRYGVQQAGGLFAETSR